MDKQNSQTGLRVKYDVKKVETGETVNNCFVLRPDKDPAAVVALRTYARVTPNKALADDIITWVGAEPADKPLSEWTLGEARAECRGRTPTGFDKNKACVGCPLNGKVCDDCENVFFPFAPEDWKIDGETEAKTEREGLEPSSMGETKAQKVDVGADSKPARSKLAEVLGVEEDEEWKAYSAVHRIHKGKREVKRGQNWVQGDNETFLTVLINNPSQIKRLPRPRLTEPEIAIMRVMNAKYVTRLGNSTIGLWGEKPAFDVDAPDGLSFTFSYRGEQFITEVSASLFPSVKPGECIGLEGKYEQ